MMQFRHLAHAVVASALAAGCSQSLFDAGPGGSDNGNRDAGSEPVPDAREGTPDATEGIPDAPAGTPDAGMVTPDDGGAIPDAGGARPDASQGCTTPPCVYSDEAFGDFDGTQDGRNGRWRYIEVLSETDSYADMSSFTFPNDVTGFIGTGTPEPSLAYCPTGVTVAPCVELEGFLALTTTAPGANHPALIWTAPEPGRYSVYAIFRAASNAPAVETIMMLTHNDQTTILTSQALVITDTESEFSTFANVDAGDVIVLSAIATTGSPVSVGVNLFITGPD